MNTREPKDWPAGMPSHPHRRDFGRMALTGTLGAAALLAPAGQEPVAANRTGPGPGSSSAPSLPPGRRTSNCSSSSRSAPSM